MFVESNHFATDHLQDQKFLWESFVDGLIEADFDFPALKVAYLAQCMLESNFGNSKLFKTAGNPTGIKWREEMRGFATSLTLTTPTEPQGEVWCAWDTPESAIRGYWRFIGRDRYRGWQQYSNDPAGYIQHLVNCGYATDSRYVQKVVALFPEAEALLDKQDSQRHDDHDVPTVASYFKVDLDSDRKPILYAAAGANNVSSLKSIVKQELCDFWQKHQQARTVRLSNQIKKIDESLLQALPKAVNPQVTWFQFWRTEDDDTALLGMAEGFACNALVSNTKADIVQFLSAHRTARTIQAANSTSPLPEVQRMVRDGEHTSEQGHLRPQIELVPGCPHVSSRNGQAIDAIVVHYTTSRSVDGTISWFKNPRSEVSAHYIIDRNGKIYQMVRDADKAWHCAGFNATSIGIEHVAQPGDRLTAAQEQASAALIRWLCAEYRISSDRIFGHNWNPLSPGGTSCPGSLWSSPQDLKNWLKQKVFTEGTTETRRDLMPARPRPPADESVPAPPTAGKLTSNSPYTLLVTPHIQYGEICKWEERRRFRTQSQCDVALRLCQFLEQVRTHFGDRPIIITSGHRPPAVNAEQGGVPDSEHLYDGGKGAIDFYVEGVDVYRVQDYCLRNWAHSVGRGAPRGFVHLGYGRGRVQWDY